MSRDKVDVWVGMFVLLGAAALVFLALQAGNLGSMRLGQSTYDIKANFENIGGLKMRAAVKSAGVVIGRVVAIDFDDKRFQAVATLQLDSRYRFPDDSSVKILTSGLLGEQYIGIEAGGSDDLFKAGSTAKYTQSAIVLENLISQFLYGKAAEGPPATPAPAAAAPAAPEPAAKP
ncbi:outer membrane lipid asymmetry maintenance protein MlaD [Pigmentiphaga aceris]|uniref:Outer membrane lipid asymmetry maintenance protein MlaD n=1 Tax=Pigmentiphaga aceris TaxID=1940612 RepID=A0A5C0ATB0_9BURK|nr:outer membrane lipid asymmetry maintenance protein MlaD [Pigmentiphaga aceris]QEI04886.1 outer membrane lipid asymmetry maintenance protein MlaD [Pigmentiphaga aceris]